MTWLVPYQTAAISAHVLSTPDNHAPVYSACYLKPRMIISSKFWTECKIDKWRDQCYQKNILGGSFEGKTWFGAVNNILCSFEGKTWLNSPYGHCTYVNAVTYHTDWVLKTNDLLAALSVYGDVQCLRQNLPDGDGFCLNCFYILLDCLLLI